MRNANWTRILTILLALLAFYALLAVLAGIIQRFIVPLLLVILAAILAFILTPVVNLIQTRFHVFRWLSILITYLLVATVLGSVGLLLTAPLIAQTKALVDATKTPTHLQNVLAVRSKDSLFVSLVRRYSASLSSGDTCAAAAAMGTLAASAANCTGTPRVPVDIPRAFGNLEAAIPGLHRSSVIAAPPSAVKKHIRSAPVPTTPVPESYIKPLLVQLPTLRSDIVRARSDLSSGNGSRFTADAASLLSKARALHTSVARLYSEVKTTPIFILALQVKIDKNHLPFNLRKLLGSAVGKLTSQGATVLNNAVTILESTITVIFQFFIIIIMSFYLLADGGRFIGWVLGLLPEHRHEQAWFFIKSLDDVLGGYIRGQVIVAITIGILAGAGCYAIGVPYALLIGIFAFVAESIPVIGPVLASIPAILVALFTLPFIRTLIVVAWFVFIQQVEQNVVGPRITGRAVGIHPVVAMVAIIIGLQIGGFWGAFLAVPVTGLLTVLARTAYNTLVRQQPLPTAAVPEEVEVPEDVPAC